MNDLLLPFQLDFMRDAFIIGGMIAVPCALLSCFLVLKGWSLMGDAVSHAVLPGIVLAYILNIPLLIGAFVAGMACALATGFLTDHSRIKQDTVMGVVFSGMFGMGLVLYTWIESEVHLDHILFGNMLGIDAQDLWTAGIVGGLVSLALLVRWRDLMLHAFDAAHARALGLPVALFHYGLLALLSLTIVSTLSAVGIILAIGLLIAPGAIAFLVTRRFGAMLAVAVAVTLVASWGGIYASFWIDSAPAPTIILGLTLIFIAAFLWKSITIRRAENGRASQTG
ncbi:manganese/iron transport system permease protein [Limimaricola variabilis]|jgi:manganese/iron transport system permease protein|uniref:Manganese/iron transport system permease protein n=1 Tax=Limimaricola variabilis TaxID=1492771 RepID=A0ABR6HMF7_9RHOB|nr:metal ABC transporter permease [Limimaricola variabilis]MBB3711635.1 manganese/iron transport system permease protein [Limimaricola variabilis]WPY94527.1 metal ABC transporter permease [Limimaricola variabilis]